MLPVGYEESTRRGGTNPTLSVILTAARWLGLLAALWLLWDSAAFALIPRRLFVPF